MKSKSATAAYILIGLGIIFLLSNLGWLPPSLTHGSVAATDSHYCRCFGVDQPLFSRKTVDRFFGKTNWSAPDEISYSFPLNRQVVSEPTPPPPSR